MSSVPFVELDLESQIDWNLMQVRTARTPDERRAAWERAKHLIAMRTPETVESMERERGIHR
jgi:hypothetical protein